MKLKKPLLKLIRETNRKVLKPISGESIVHWCEQNVNLEGSVAITGPFRVASSRYMVEPLKAAQDWSISEIVLLKATQTGGSLVGQLILEWFIANRPLPAMQVMQTNADAIVHQTQRIIPNLRANKAIAPFLPKDPRQLKEDGIKFSHMSFLINGPSRDRIHGKTIGLLILDELWRYGRDSFLEYARKRVAYFKKHGMSKVVIVSQAGEEDDDLDRAWKQTSMEEWNVPCEMCKEYFFPDIEHFNCNGKKWNDPELKLKNPDDTYNYGKLEELLTLQCPKCGHLHTDTPSVKQYWNENGKYIQTNPTPLKGHRGFRWNSIICDPWIDIVKEFLDAKAMLDKGMVDPLLTFFQQRLARAINVWGYFVKGKRVQSNVDYDPKDKIPNEVERFFGVDIQEDRMYGSIFAFSKDGGQRLIWFGELFDITDILEKQKEYTVKPEWVLCDTGFRTREVYSWILKYGFTGIKGVGGRRGFRVTRTDRRGRQVSYFKFWKRSDPDPSTGGIKDKRIKAPFYLLAVDSIKDVLVRLRDGKGSEFLALPSDKYDIEVWNRHMFSEYKKKDTSKSGNPTYYWKKIKSDEPNHYWDCAVYALSGAIMHPLISIKENTSLPSSDYTKETTVKDTDTDE